MLDNADEQQAETLFATEPAREENAAAREESEENSLPVAMKEQDEHDQPAEIVEEREQRATISPEEEVFPKVPAKVEPYFQALFCHYTTFRDMEGFKINQMVTQLQVFFDKPFVTSSKLRDQLLDELKNAKKNREPLLRFLLECLKNFNQKFEKIIERIPDVPSINGGRV